MPWAERYLVRDVAGEHETMAFTNVSVLASPVT